MIFGRTPVFFLPCCVIIASLSGVVAKPPEPPETPDLSEKKATTYLAAYGYLNTTSHHITKNDLKEALLKFQSFMDLPKTGELDREVRETMLLIRCGVSDRPVEGSIDSRIWHKSILTWNISSFPETIPESEVRETAHNAFSTWEKALSINFLETSQGRHADIVINFLEQAPEGSHDITGNAVAETVGARIFLRRDHQWNIFPKDSAIDSSNLFQAFLHEIGHVLGLHHSHETNSVMYPIFTQTNGKSDLSASDVEAVRGLYGVVQGTAELSPGSTEKERKCPKSLNAVMQANNQHIFVFKGDHFWKFKNQKVVQGPLPLHQAFPNGPKIVNASVTSRDLTVLFEERTIYGYEMDKKTGLFKRAANFPKILHERVLFFPRAAFPLSNGSVILISDDVFATYDLWKNEPTMLNDKKVFYPNLPDIRGGIPQSAESENVYWMFSENSVYVYDTFIQQITSKTPLSHYFTCE